MGIKNLNAFLRDQTRSAFCRVALRDFRRTFVAVDATLWGYALFAACWSRYIDTHLTEAEMLTSGAHGEKAVERVHGWVFESAARFLEQLYTEGVVPVFVFDGESVPEKSSGARQRRIARRDQTAARVDALRTQISETDPVFRRADDFSALRKLLRQTPVLDPARDIAALRAHLAGPALAAIVCSAPCEAEKFCAQAAASGLVSAAWTTDTDAYAFGAPLVITGFSEKRVDGSLAVNVVVVPVCRAALGVTPDEFIDVCIAFGCDFNTSMPGIGAKRAWDLLRPYVGRGGRRLIEAAAATRPSLEWEALNAERCREIFTSESCPRDHPGFKLARTPGAAHPGVRAAADACPSPRRRLALRSATIRV